MFSRWRLLIVAHFSPKIISLGKCVFITAVAKNYFWPSPLNLRASLNTAIEMIAHLQTRYNHARKHTNIILRKANCVLSSFSAMKIPAFFRTIDSVEKSSWTIWVAGRVGRFLFFVSNWDASGTVYVRFACNSSIDSFVRLKLEPSAIIRRSFADHFGSESRHNLQLHPIMYIHLCDTETRMIYILLTGSECISIELEFAKISFYIGLI